MLGGRMIFFMRVDLLFPQTYITVSFIRLTPKNPILWTGIKGVSVERRVKQMLKQVQHDV